MVKLFERILHGPLCVLWGNDLIDLVNWEVSSANRYNRELKEKHPDNKGDSVHSEFLYQAILELYSAVGKKKNLQKKEWRDRY